MTSKPFAIIDHHTSRQNFGFDIELEIVEEAVATAELVTKMAQALNWPINERAARQARQRNPSRLTRPNHFRHYRRKRGRHG
ncbi:DHH family phosphoesterase [bacterium]|nr:MAG: DHH family phosphoesterase [bacterium]